MRSFKSTLVLIAFMVCFMAREGLSSASESINTRVQSKSIILTSNEKLSAVIQVQLTDMDGRILLADKIEVQDNVQKKYNLTNLPDGVYQLEISDDQNIVNKVLTIHDDLVSITKETKWSKPRFYMKNKTLTVSFLPFGEKTTILVYDSVGRQLVNESFKGEQAISRKYNFSKIEIGEYRIKLLVDGRVFSKTVNIFI